jgi:trans-aconitate methyltransferase
LGCGEGHQTEYLAKISDTQYGVDVSAQAVERARKRLPQAHFEATDVFGQPWGEQAHRFDLVTACEMLYFLSEPEKTITRMRHLGRYGLVTLFAPAGGSIGPHLDTIPGLHKDWIYHGDTVWLIAWWRDA